MSQALYRKWRSQSFENVIGQEHVAITLRNALHDGRLSHAYLFTGPRGTGKTSLARILAKAINCLDPDPKARPCNHCAICTAITEGRQLDLIEIDAASNRGIDEIRDLREKIGFRPNEARYKVYIIDEVHMLTKEAFNALLKTLEEPQPHAIFVLATTEPDRVPETVRSRCQRFDFRRIPTAEIVEHLSQIVKAEGAQAAAEALVAIARRATGSMRDAISLLDQLLSYGDEVLGLARVERVLGLVNAGTIGRLVDLMTANNAGGGLALLNEMVAEGVELGQLTDQIVAYLRAVLFVRVVRAPEMLDLPQDVVAVVTRQAEALTPAALLIALREFMDARGALRDQVPGVPQLPLELAFLRAALPQSETGRQVDKETGRQGDKETSRQGDKETSRQGDKETSRQGSAAPTVSQPPPAPVRAVLAPAITPERAAPTVGAALAGRTPAPGGVGAASVAPAVAVTTSPPQRTTAAPAGAPAQKVATQPAPESAPGERDAGLLQAARANWDRFLAAAGKRCGMKVQAALRSVHELDVVGQTLVLRFTHAFARDLVGGGENRGQVEAVWDEVLGRKVQVRCGLVGEAPPPSPAQPASRGVSDDEAFLQGARELGAVVKKLD